MEQHTVLGSGHGEFTDAPVDILCAAVLSIEAWIAWDGGLDTGGDVSTSTKGEWDVGGDFNEHTATGITGGFWFLGDGWIGKLEGFDVTLEGGFEDL